MLKPHLQEELSGYLAGDLEGRMLEEVEDHLRNCALCRADLDRLKRVEEALNGESPIEPSADFTSRVMRSVDQERKVFRYDARTILGGLAAAAAIAFLLLSLRVQRDVPPPAEMAQKPPIKAVEPPKASRAPPDVVEELPAPAEAPVAAALSAEDIELIAHLDELENMEVIDEYESLVELNTAIVAIPAETTQ
jgi:hypothetical protein